MNTLEPNKAAGVDGVILGFSVSFFILDVVGFLRRHSAFR